MFRTAIKTLSLFRKVNSYNYGIRNTNTNTNIRLKNIENPKLYNDALNMFMLSAFVKESVKNKNKNNINESSQQTEPKVDEDCEYCINFKNRDKELKIMCQITGCEKRTNDIDCNCKDKCIVDKSELSIICDLL